MQINIGEANQGDAFYRYKMPTLQARVSLNAQHFTVITAVHRLIHDKPQLSCNAVQPQWRTVSCLTHAVLLVQIEGRGNGIKTNVTNNVDIAKALERPPECESPQINSLPA